jgi:hypothetical protein
LGIAAQKLELVVDVELRLAMEAALAMNVLQQHSGEFFDL